MTKKEKRARRNIANLSYQLKEINDSLVLSNPKLYASRTTLTFLIDVMYVLTTKMSEELSNIKLREGEKPLW